MEFLLLKCLDVLTALLQCAQILWEQQSPDTSHHFGSYCLGDVCIPPHLA